MATTWFYEPFYEIDRLMHELVASPERRAPGREGGDATLRPIRPKMDLHENTQTNVVTAIVELPGVAKDQINLEVQSGRLNVSGEIKRPEGCEEGTCAVKERRYGKFQRMIQLPQGIQEKNIKATMQDGLLTVTFPRAAPEMAPKKITIS